MYVRLLINSVRIEPRDGSISYYSHCIWMCNCIVPCDLFKKNSARFCKCFLYLFAAQLIRSSGLILTFHQGTTHLNQRYPRKQRSYVFCRSVGDFFARRAITIRNIVQNRNVPQHEVKVSLTLDTDASRSALEVFGRYAIPQEIGHNQESKVDMTKLDICKATKTFWAGQFEVSPTIQLPTWWNRASSPFWNRWANHALDLAG